MFCYKMYMNSSLRQMEFMVLLTTSLKQNLMNFLARLDMLVLMIRAVKTSAIAGKGRMRTIFFLVTIYLKKIQTYKIS